jgi:AraC-like DNA-binding protein
MTSSHHDRESESLDPASARVSTPVAGDPLSDVLETIRLRGALFFLWEPSWPFGVGVADGESLSRHIVPGTDCVISYHIVTRGPCWAAVRGEQPIRLETGEILVLPHGDAYKIADSPQFPSAADEAASIEFFKAMSRGEIPPVVSDGGSGPDNSRLICGFLGCSLRPYNPLLSTLPRMIRIPAPQVDGDPLSSLIEFALSESKQSRGGERCLLMRLSEVMFVEVLRRYLRASCNTGSGWMEGLHHPVVGRALGLLHQNIAYPWTLQELARRSGASRSTLAERFSQMVGTPPMQYLTNWRMQVAASRLAEHSTKVYTVANEVGYESEAAFSRAFKRVVGISPGAWREQARRSPV